MSNKQSGSVLLMVVFSLVMMALLGGALLQNRVVVAQSTTESVISSRAWFAAHSSMEWALSELFPLDQPIGQCVAEVTSPLPLPQCVAKVRCKQTPEGLYQLESEATCGQGQFARTRVQTVWAENGAK